jgi:hypothetical protein
MPGFVTVSPQHSSFISAASILFPLSLSLQSYPSFVPFSQSRYSPFFKMEASSFQATFLSLRRFDAKSRQS